MWHDPCTDGILVYGNMLICAVAADATIIVT